MQFRLYKVACERQSTKHACRGYPANTLPVIPDQMLLALAAALHTQAHSMILIQLQLQNPNHPTQ
jgi:hypothetical protein